MKAISPPRYLAIMLGLIVAIFIASWFVTAYARWHFLEFTYGEWRAKLDMIESCDVGDTVIIGDSRPSASYVPRLMGEGVRNFAFTGMSPVEGYYVTRKILACPRPPKRYIIAFSPRLFKDSRWFWSHGVTFGALRGDDLTEVAAMESRFGRHDLYNYNFGAEPPPAIKNWLYDHHFPPFEFAALIAAATENRYRKNVDYYREVLANRGQHVVGVPLSCATRLTWEAEQAAFEQNPLNDAYFRRMLDAIHTAGGKVEIGPIPFSAMSIGAMKPSYRQAFDNYVLGVAASRPWLAMPRTLMPVMDNCAFGDDGHVNDRGASQFSRAFVTGSID